MPPRISALIPSYNHAQYLNQTIESVLGQTFEDFELHIIDDGSTDNSWDIIESYAAKDKRIKATRQANQGLIPTLNELAARAQGEFIAQLDSDDMWFPKRLAWGLEDMERFPQLSASFCSFVRIDGNSDLTGHITQFSMGELRGQVLMNNEAISNCLCACTGFIRHSALKEAGLFARPFTLAHDWDRWLRLSLHGELFHRPDIGALNRIHATNQSHDLSGCYRQCLVISEEMTPRVLDHYKLGEQAYRRFYTHMTNLALKVLDYETAARILRKKGKMFDLEEYEVVILLQCLAVGSEKHIARELAKGLQLRKQSLHPEHQRKLEAVQSALGI